MHAARRQGEIDVHELMRYMLIRGSMACACYNPACVVDGDVKSALIVWASSRYEIAANEHVISGSSCRCFLSFREVRGIRTRSNTMISTKRTARRLALCPAA
jgi:hypothetical protein